LEAKKVSNQIIVVERCHILTYRPTDRPASQPASQPASHPPAHLQRMRAVLVRDARLRQHLGEQRAAQLRGAHAVRW
jgi:hypothetical protein